MENDGSPVEVEIDGEVIGSKITQTVGGTVAVYLLIDKPAKRREVFGGDAAAV